MDLCSNNGFNVIPSFLGICVVVSVIVKANDLIRRTR
jgi:hypothetical protein